MTTEWNNGSKYHPISQLQEGGVWELFGII